MKYGIIWTAQTQHLPGSWHLSSAALLLVNIWLAHAGQGWGLFAPYPQNCSFRKVFYRRLGIGKKSHKHLYPASPQVPQGTQLARREAKIQSSVYPASKFSLPYNPKFP